MEASNDSIDASISANHNYDFLQQVPPDLKNRINMVGKKTTKEDFEKIIEELCSIKPLRPLDLGILLNRSARYIREFYLVAMVDKGKLELLFPGNMNHPYQAYRAKKKPNTN